jgi:hypothetical protein
MYFIIIAVVVECIRICHGQFLIRSKYLKNISKHELLLSAAIVANSDTFKNNCIQYNGKNVTVASVNYTVQAAYVWGTSCYILTNEGCPWNAARDVCIAFNPQMHLAFPSTPQEFAAIDNIANHVNYYVKVNITILLSANTIRRRRQSRCAHWI